MEKTEFLFIHQAQGYFYSYPKTRMIIVIFNIPIEPPLLMIIPLLIRRSI